MCVHIVYSVQVLTPTMTKCVGGEGARGGGGGCKSLTGIVVGENQVIWCVVGD